MPWPRCGIRNSQGQPCFNRVLAAGDLCPLHEEHNRVTPQAVGVVHRCSGRTRDGNACFVRVQKPGDLCRMHERMARGMPKRADKVEALMRFGQSLRADLERMRTDVDRMCALVAEMREPG